MGNNYYLQHWGIKGMKWGIRRTAQQLGHKVKAHRTKKQREAALEKARQARREKAEFEANKERVLKSGTATEVLKYKGKLTNQEMQTAIDRLDKEKKLAEMSAKEIKTGLDKVNSVMNKVDTIRTNVDKGINAYNTVAKISNSVAGTKLPKISDGNNEKKKDPVIEKLIKKGTPEEVSKRFGDFTVDELKNISNRFTYEENIRKRLEKDKDKDKDKPKD